MKIQRARQIVEQAAVYTKDFRFFFCPLLRDLERGTLKN